MHFSLKLENKLSHVISSGRWVLRGQKTKETGKLKTNSRKKEKGKLENKLSLFSLCRWVPGGQKKRKGRMKTNPPFVFISEDGF